MYDGQNKVGGGRQAIFSSGVMPEAINPETMDSRMMDSRTMDPGAMGQTGMMGQMGRAENRNLGGQIMGVTGNMDGGSVNQGAVREEMSRANRGGMRERIATKLGEVMEMGVPAMESTMTRETSMGGASMSGMMTGVTPMSNSAIVDETEIVTKEVLGKNGVTEMKKIVDGFLREQNPQKFYEVARKMTRVNLKNSYGRKLEDDSVKGVA